MIRRQKSKGLPRKKQIVRNSNGLDWILEPLRNIKVMLIKRFYGNIILYWNSKELWIGYFIVLFILPSSLLFHKKKCSITFSSYKESCIYLIFYIYFTVLFLDLVKDKQFTLIIPKIINQYQWMVVSERLYHIRGKVSFVNVN